MNVKLTSAQRIKVENSKGIAQIMQKILMRENELGRSQEHFWVVGLNNANKILFIELIGLGRQNRVSANPPDVFRMAIYKMAVQAILVHNHPSGEVNYSAADRAITDRMLKVGEIININVIDHLIISEKKYLSFADEGIMSELRASDTWRIVEKDELYLREMKMEIEKTKAVKKNSLDIATKMKAEGYDAEVIKKLTGLKLSEINKLKGAD